MRTANAESRKDDGMNERDLLICSSVPATRSLCLILMVSGLFLGLSSQFVLNHAELEGATRLGLFLTGTALLGAGVLFGNRIMRRDIFLSVTEQTLKFRDKTWITQRSTYQTYPLADIASFEISSEKDSDGDPVFQLTMNLRSGDAILLSDRVTVSSYLEDRKAILDDAVFGSGARLSSLLANQEDKRRLPKPVIAILLAICIIPLVAVTAGTLTHAGKVSIPQAVWFTSSSAPSASQLTLSQIAQSSCRSGETLIWFGQPEFGRESSVKMPFLFLFAVVWTMFSLVFTGLAWSGGRQRSRAGRFGSTLLGVPFVLVGCGLLVLPFFASQTEARTILVITDQGAFSYVDGKRYREVSYRDRDFGPVEVCLYKPGRGDVFFIKDLDEGRSHPYTGFYGVENPSAVASLLEKQGLVASSRPR